MHRAVGGFDDEQSLSAQFWESVDVNPVKKIIARISETVKTIEMSKFKILNLLPS